VDSLEQHYAQIDGLNLMFETREGILKHCSAANARELGELGHRFLQNKQPSLEAQLTNLADEIAYNNHDVDDGLRSGLVSIEQLEEVRLFAVYRREVEQTWPGLGGRRAIYETLRRIINALIVDLIQASQAAIEEANPQSVDEVRASPQLIRFSEPLRAQARELKQFLHANLYRHYQVNRMTSKARRIINEMFAAFLAEPGLLPSSYQLERGAPVALQARQIADYIAGMTDRFAMREHRRLFAIEEM
ncbi:MAG: deoxyguanosinetriphosphate triphosphohydrolase, partial [Burkholderiales bacterium]|nr:deoxyguanosinetriphosphate triphosphohydrolase [Burkholderiales bacterium]